MLRRFPPRSPFETDPTDELAKLADLKEKGIIDDAEYQQLRAKALA